MEQCSIDKTSADLEEAEVALIPAIDHVTRASPDRATGDGAAFQR